jgi:hypothetical protein
MLLRSSVLLSWQSSVTTSKFNKKINKFLLWCPSYKILKTFFFFWTINLTTYELLFARNNNECLLFCFVTCQNNWIKDSFFSFEICCSIYFAVSAGNNLEGSKYCFGSWINLTARFRSIADLQPCEITFFVSIFMSRCM